MDTSTFAQKIKAKYPAYQNVDDATLVTKFIEKYPVYKSQVNVQSEPTITESVSTDIQQRGQNISDINTMRNQGQSVAGEVLSTVAPKLSERVSGLLKRGQQVKQLVSNPSNDLATTGQLAGGVNDVIGEAIGAIIPEKWKQFGGEKVKQLLGTAGIDTIEKYNDWATQNPLTAKNIEGAVNIAGLLPTGKAGEVVGTAAVDTLKSGGTKLVGAVDNLIIDSKTLADDLITKSQPKVTLEQATGQIIQGKTGDVKQAVQAIGAVDTTGVKTYKDLLGKFKEKKPELLSVVDNELAKDTTQYSLDNLSTTVATNSGKKVSTNYVDSALKDLRELYSTTGDVKQLANLEELAAKGSYTLKEVNDISRVYNSEFGQKAFSKLGDPLTSVNAQRFENTRKGLKDVARRGIGGAEAKKADELLSSVYNTENLVKRNVEAVNKLRQRINERGLLEKAGHYITKYADILTGGTIRGAVAGLLPRGAGYKVLNALDLEEQLAKNLDIINNALTSKSDDIIVNQLKSLDLPIKNSASKTTPSMGAKTSTSKLNTTNDASLNSSISPVSKKNGIMSSDLSTGVKKAFNNAKETLKTLKDKNVRERGSISLESILPESKSVRNQGVSLTKNTTEDLVQQAKKYKSAEEFVKAQLDKNTIKLSKPLTVYRGEGKGIGNTTLVNGRYFAGDEKFASTFGNVTKSEVPAGTKIFDLDSIKNGNGIVSETSLVDTTKLTDFLIDNGYTYTKNTNSRGVEYVKLARTAESSSQRVPVDSFRLLDSRYKDVVNKYKTFDAFYKQAQKISDDVFNKTGKYEATNYKMLKEYFNQVKNNKIPVTNLKPESKLEEIWKKANKK